MTQPEDYCDDREDATLARMRENAPVIGTCPFDGCGGKVKDYGSSIECRDCGASWPDEGTFKAATPKAG